MNVKRFPTTKGAKRTHGWCRFHRSSNDHDSADCRDVHQHLKRRGWVYEPYHQPEIEVARRRAVEWEYHREKQEFEAKWKNAAWQSPGSNNGDKSTPKKRKTVTFANPVCNEEYRYRYDEEWNPAQSTPAPCRNTFQSAGIKMCEDVLATMPTAKVKKHLQVTRKGKSGWHKEDERKVQHTQPFGTTVRETTGKTAPISGTPLQQQQPTAICEAPPVHPRFPNPAQPPNGTVQPELVDRRSHSIDPVEQARPISASMKTTATPTAHVQVLEPRPPAQMAALGSGNPTEKTHQASNQTATVSPTLDQEEECEPVGGLTLVERSIRTLESNVPASPVYNSMLVKLADGDWRTGRQSLPSTPRDVDNETAPTTSPAPVMIEIGPTAEGPIEIDVRHQAPTPVIFSLSLIPGMEVTFRLPSGEIHVTHCGVDPGPDIGAAPSTASQMATATDILAADETPPLWASQAPPANSIKQLKPFFEWFAQRRQQTRNLDARAPEMTVFTCVRGMLASQGVTVHEISEMICNDWLRMGIETDLGSDIARAAGRYAKLRKVGMDI